MRVTCVGALAPWLTLTGLVVLGCGGSTAAPSQDVRYSPGGQCATWQPGGSAQTISESVVKPNSIAPTSLVVDGASALAAWNAQPLEPGPGSLETRLIDFGGDPVSAIATASFLSFNPVWEVAVSGSVAAALVDDDKYCRVWVLDASGAAAATSPPVEGTCFEIAPTPTGFLSLTNEFGGAGTVLTSLDVQGKVLASTTLAAFEQGNAGSGVVFDDGSFALAWSTAAGQVYAQAFDAKGAPLADPVLEPSLKFLMAMVRTGTGALVFGSSDTRGSSLLALPIGRDANPSGSAQLVAHGDTTHPAFAHGAAEAPAGDVLLLWAEWDVASNTTTSYAQALAPDGTARGPGTRVQAGDTVFAAVSPDGQRAAVLSALTSENDESVEVIPLICSE